jgi:plasmid stabilization system protein ParE
MRTYRVRFTADAENDLIRLYGFLLNQDLEAAERAREAMQAAIELLQFSPFSCRKASDDPLLRELVIPFGSAGYVALFEIEGPSTITILAVRHQREDDYH